MHSTRGPLQVVHYSNLGPLHRRIHYSNLGPLQQVHYMRSTTDPGPLQRTGGSGRTSGHRPYRQIGQREASDAWSQWTWLDEATSLLLVTARGWMRTLSSLLDVDCCGNGGSGRRVVCGRECSAGCPLRSPRAQPSSLLRPANAASLGWLILHKAGLDRSQNLSRKEVRRQQWTWRHIAVLRQRRQWEAGRTCRSINGWG